jgi:hypothetical protein
MDGCARLKRSHLIDIQVCLKSKKRAVGEKSETDEDVLEGKFEENCLFIGIMQEEENNRRARPKLLQMEKEVMLQEVEQ